MTRFKNVLACMLLSVAAVGASAETGNLQGHQLRLSAVDQPDVNWITQEDVKTAERTTSASRGQPVLRLTLTPEATQRMLALTSANIGKKVRFTWDGSVVSELTVASGFGSPFELPVPPN
jgi:preprotein translocase subunit SecD